MKILALYPGIIPRSKSDLRCFSDVLGFYLLTELQRHVKLCSLEIPPLDHQDGSLARWFRDLDLDDYDAVVALGLRYFSTVNAEIGRDLCRRMSGQGFVCQIHDGSRLDNDPVDITFTLKDDAHRYPFGTPANRLIRHRAYNEYIGWASDPDVNRPGQSETSLSILVDHTNYGPNPVDRTRDILSSIKDFVSSDIWKPYWQEVIVRRFESGRVADVDLDSDFSDIERYDRSVTMPFVDITQAHGHAHVFCVTHPESVGMVVLETAMAGALPLVPRGFVPDDRLATVRHLVYDQTIDWRTVLEMIDVEESRARALENDWTRVALRMRDALWVRQRIRFPQRFHAKYVGEAND